MLLWQSDKTNDEKLEILLSHSFKEIVKNRELVVTLLQLAKSYFGYHHSMCGKDHLMFYNKLRNLKTKSDAGKIGAIS